MQLTTCTTRSSPWLTPFVMKRPSLRAGASEVPEPCLVMKEARASISRGCPLCVPYDSGNASSLAPANDSLSLVVDATSAVRNSAYGIQLFGFGCPFAKLITLDRSPRDEREDERDDEAALSFNAVIEVSRSCSLQPSYSCQTLLWTQEPFPRCASFFMTSMTPLNLLMLRFLMAK